MKYGFFVDGDDVNIGMKNRTAGQYFNWTAIRSFLTENDYHLSVCEYYTRPVVNEGHVRFTYTVTQAGYDVIISPQPYFITMLLRIVDLINNGTIEGVILCSNRRETGPFAKWCRDRNVQIFLMGTTIHDDAKPYCTQEIILDENFFMVKGS